MNIVGQIIDDVETNMNAAPLIDWAFSARITNNTTAAEHSALTALTDL